MRTNKIDLASVEQLFRQQQYDLVVCVDLYTMRSERNIRDLRRAVLDANWGAASFVLRRMRSTAVHLELIELVVVLKRTELKIKRTSFAELSMDIDEIIRLSQFHIDEVRGQLNKRSAS